MTPKVHFRSKKGARAGLGQTFWNEERTCGRDLASPAQRGEKQTAVGAWDQTACKPGSVPPDAEAPDAAAIPLDRPSRDGSRDLPGFLGPATALPRERRGTPIRSCSWRGLSCGDCYQPPGGLLPHPFTLRSAKRGGLLSVALSLGSPPAGVTRRHVVVEPGLSSNAPKRARDRPAVWSARNLIVRRRRVKR